MKKATAPAFLFLLFTGTLQAQLCPGGGTNFASAVLFSESWIQGCLTGTSCNGGIEFDNRSSCEPTTAMDACAPGPSCTTNSQDGSDIWFKFFANTTSAVINVIQNVSFVVTVQAFSGGPTCGALTEIGCAKASGPSSGVTLNLSGLTPGEQYFYRIFGSASAASQRTGTYCFCGSSGLSSFVLPVVMTEFKATPQKGKNLLQWTTASESNSKWFDVERSTDGNHFEIIGRRPAKGHSTEINTYRFTDLSPSAGINYYRLKQVDRDDRYVYSSIVSAKLDFPVSIQVFPVPASGTLIIQSGINGPANIFNTLGLKISTVMLKKGRNELDISALAAGVYLIRTSQQEEATRFQVFK